MPLPHETRIPENKHHPRQVIAICALLATLVFIAFGQTIAHGFVNFDDDLYIYQNPIVAKGFSLAGLRWSLTAGQIGHWHPLTWLTHMLDCQLFGLWAGGHHLTNVLLHAAAVVLLFLVLLQMTGSLWRCAFVAAAWAVHPLRAESVAWISERKDVLSALFFMVALGAYIRYVRKPSPSRYLLVLVSFALGLLSKNMLVTLPCVLLLLDYWPLRRPNQFSRLVYEKIPLFVLSAISCVITFLVPEKVAPAKYLPLWLRLENVIVSYGIYLRQTLWPAALAPYYPNPTHAFLFSEVAGSLALLCIISAAAIGLRKTHPYLLTGWLWFVGMLVPVIGLVQISTYAHADRYTYLPQIGLYLAGTWMVADWVGQGRARRVTLGAAALTILSALLVAAWHQTTYWRDSETLWTHTLECTEDNYVAHYNLGTAMLDDGRTDDAIAQFNKTLEINSTYVDARNNLGMAFVKQGRMDQAISEFREAVKIDPSDGDAHNNLGMALDQQGRTQEAIAEYREAVKINPANADACYNLGMALDGQGRTEDAIAAYREALRINPGDADTHSNLGGALLEEGRVDEAVAQYREASRIHPADARAHSDLAEALSRQGGAEDAIAEYREALGINPAEVEAGNSLGNLLLSQGRTAEAIDALRKALEHQPANATIQNTLAWILATASQPSLRNGAGAVQLATQASQSSGGGNPVFLDTLAAAYAEAGRFPEAIQTAQKALKLAEAQSNAALAATLSGEIKLYQAGRPL
jgi:tetratricopeptide (TPR) repeat protein